MHTHASYRHVHAWYLISNPIAMVSTVTFPNVKLMWSRHHQQDSSGFMISNCVQNKINPLNFFAKGFCCPSIYKDGLSVLLQRQQFNVFTKFKQLTQLHDHRNLLILEMHLFCPTNISCCFQENQYTRQHL